MKFSPWHFIRVQAHSPWGACMFVMPVAEPIPLRPKFCLFPSLLASYNVQAVLPACHVGRSSRQAGRPAPLILCLLGSRVRGFGLTALRNGIRPAAC